MNYYRQNVERIFNAVEQPQWRIWKSVDTDGVVRQNKSQISTPPRLLDFIHTHPLKALYVSVSTFLNPHKNHGFFRNQQKEHNDHYFYPRSGYLCADCILLDTYFFIDLDSEDDLRIAQNDARKIIMNLEYNVKLKLYSIQFSGRKGIHLIYNMKKRQIEDPLKRIEYYRNQKKKFSEQIERLKLRTIDNHHLSIMQDMFRVYAAPYSIKSTGHMVQPLDLNTFMKEDIYNLIQASEPKGDEMKVATVESSTSTVSGKEEAGLTSYPHYFSFMDNMVKGLKNNYITVIKIHKSKYNINKLQELQKLYKLSDFYINKIGDYIYAYNTKLVQYKRLAKILKAANSENYSFFLTRKHIPIQISDTYTKTGKVEVKYLETLESNYGKNDTHSKPHSILFNLKYKKMAGRPNRTGWMRVK